jgi:hypothetical protein
MSHVVAWICLVLVACTAAYGLQLTAAAVVEPSAAAETVTSDPPARQVLIVAVDPVSGGRTQVVCDARANAFVSDGLLVDATDVPTAAQACIDTDAPVMRAGSPY